MRKSFYASGFIYHTPSRQILLQQLTDTEGTPLIMFRAKGNEGESPQMVFVRSIKETIGISIDINSVKPVYDYVNGAQGDQYIFYVDITSSPEPSSFKNQTVGWYPMAKLSKLHLEEQTRHDIIIGERVIRAQAESDNPQPRVIHPPRTL
jgi:hypothetical protein